MARRKADPEYPGLWLVMMLVLSSRKVYNKETNDGRQKPCKILDTKRGRSEGLERAIRINQTRKTKKCF